MGKPYGHKYFFLGSGNVTGTMICEKCNSPIFNHSQDWMSYEKSKSHDWAFHCFHRKCCVDQSGWEIIEKKNAAAQIRMDLINADFATFIAKHKVTDWEAENLLVGFRDE